MWKEIERQEEAKQRNRKVGESVSLCLPYIPVGGVFLTAAVATTCDRKITWRQKSMLVTLQLRV